MASFLKPTQSSMARISRERTSTLQDLLDNRPSPCELTRSRILRPGMGVGSNVVDRAIILERKRKQNELVARLIQRPERYDLHKQGILLTPPRNQREEEKLLQNSLRVDLKKGKNTSFVVKSSGTKSRSQIAREEREKELYEQRQKHVQRKLEVGGEGRFLYPLNHARFSMSLTPPPSLRSSPPLLRTTSSPVPRKRT